MNPREILLALITIRRDFESNLPPISSREDVLGEALNDILEHHIEKIDTLIDEIDADINEED